MDFKAKASLQPYQVGKTLDTDHFFHFRCVCAAMSVWSHCNLVYHITTIYTIHILRGINKVISIYLSKCYPKPFKADANAERQSVTSADPLSEVMSDFECFCPFNTYLECNPGRHLNPSQLRTSLKQWQQSIVAMNDH